MSVVDSMVAGAKHERIGIHLHRGASPRQQRELGAFVRYCVERIERDLGAQDRWSVRITMSSVTGYGSWVEVHHLGMPLEASGSGSDGVLATWDAMGRIEQLLRERRGSVTPYVDRDAK